MKNTLAENMLRFGVKNLQESDIKKIEESTLDEAPTPNGTDPSWLTQASKYYADQQGGLAMKFKPGVKYTQQYSFAAGGMRQGGIIIMPKGTSWQTSPSTYFLIGKGFKVNNPDTFGYASAKDPYGTTPQQNGLKDGMYLAKAAAGKAIGTDKKPVTVTPILIGYYGGNIFYQGGDFPLSQNWPTDNLAKMFANFEA